MILGALLGGAPVSSRRSRRDGLGGVPSKCVSGVEGIDPELLNWNESSVKLEGVADKSLRGGVLPRLAGEFDNITLQRSEEDGWSKEEGIRIPPARGVMGKVEHD